MSEIHQRVKKHEHKLSSLGSETLQVFEAPLAITDYFQSRSPDLTDRLKNVSERLVASVVSGRDSAMRGQPSGDNGVSIEDYIPDFPEWRRLVPRALALEPLYNPYLSMFPDGDSKISDSFREWSMYALDPAGIRVRGEVVENLILEYASMSDKPLPRQKWGSLACGTARSTIGALAHIAKGNMMGEDLPQVFLVDYDKKALEYAKLQGEGRLNDLTTNPTNLRVVRSNILKKEGIVDSRVGLNDGSFDVLEAVGFVEYLPDSDDGVYEYDKVAKSSRNNRAGAGTFLKNAYELVAQGGTFIFGNMLDTHPGLDFTKKVIEWPHIQPRSKENVVKLVREAGLEGNLTVYTTPDGVYAVYAIQKLA